MGRGLEEKDRQRVPEKAGLSHSGQTSWRLGKERQPSLF